MLTIIAAVPFYNNQDSIARTIDSLKQQTYPLSGILVINDGSKSLPAWLINQEGISLFSFNTNRGRGAVRAFAIEQAHTDLILFCDASIALPENFAAQAAEWFSDSQVAGVFGRLRQERGTSIVDRWRARHLFKEKAGACVSRAGLLATYSCLLRRSAVLEAGNFNPYLVHSEDAELGHRLLDKGLDVIFDPALSAFSTVSNTLPQVLERYWRWHVGADEGVDFKKYIKQIYFSLKVMALQDLAEGDLLSVPISLFVPHYQFWRSWRQTTNKQALFRE
jgi:cellulose synthase/poly-beta-1,6-N-acetylglucosamine synthase-like glycosyltransferase